MPQIHTSDKAGNTAGTGKRQDTFRMPSSAVKLTPLQMNSVRFSGKHTLLTPAYLARPLAEASSSV